MKILTALLVTLVTSSVFAEPSNLRTIANHDDFAILSDEDQSSLNVFLSYTGERFDHCGLVFYSMSWEAGAVELSEVLEVTSLQENVGEVVTDKAGGKRFIAKVANRNINTYGQVFVISTKSGESLKQALSGLSPGKVEVIVKNLPCKNISL